MLASTVLKEPILVALYNTVARILYSKKTDGSFLRPLFTVLSTFPSFSLMSCNLGKEFIEWFLFCAITVSV